LANLPSSSVDPFAPPSADLAPRPLGHGEKQRLAERGHRLVAVIVDTAALFALAGTGYGIGIALSNPLGLSGEPEKGLGALIAMLLALPLQIYQWYLMSTRGQSLGKRWLRIKVVRVDGSDVDFVQGVLLRSWVLLGVAVLLGILGIAPVARLLNSVDTLSIFTSNRRMIHDLIAGTKVISTEPAASI
jgi:uncharacterized RDD family membrane protein YckC